MYVSSVLYAWYLQMVLSLTVLNSDASYAENNEDRKILKLSNYTGPFPKDKLRDVEELRIIDSTITVAVGEDPESPGPSVPKLKKFVAKHTKFHKIPDHKWVIASNLEDIILDTVDMPLHLSNYKSYHNLKILHSKNTKFGHISRNSLEHLNKLKSLHLISAGITGFENDAFIGLDNLEYLDLSGNQLETIPKRILSPLRNLRTLTLMDNKFTKFDTENLPELPELRKIDLRRNPVSDVDVEGLKKVAPKLESILVGENV